MLKNFKFLRRNILSVKKSFFANIDYSYDTREFLKKVDDYEKKVNDHKDNQFMITEEPISGHATVEGTEKYSLRNKEEVHSKHFRKFYNSNLTCSSIGLGTYVGPPDDITDFYIYNSLKTCVFSGGVNLIDTAINYRYMKSEKAIGKAINALINKYDYSRDQLIICSKIGYVPEDADNGHRSHYFVSKLVEENKLGLDDIIFDEKNRPIHCIHPEFLNSQLNFSLDNLKLCTIDIMYLQNLIETQGPVIHKDLLNKKIAIAFEFLEKARSENKIKNYGMATWQCFRVNQNNSSIHANLQNIYKIAEQVGGKDHGFRFVQAPINVMNPEAFVEKYQTFVKDDKAALGTLTAICCELEINLISSSPLLQGYLVNTPLENNTFNVKHNASKHIQFIRSIPSESLKCTLVGMNNPKHIYDNLELITKPPLTLEEFQIALLPKKRQPFNEKDSNAF